MCRLRRVWSRRRFKGTVVLFVEAISQLLNLSFFIIPNVYVLVRPCGWRDDIVLWSAFASWTCWNTLFLLSLVRYLSAFKVHRILRPSLEKAVPHYPGFACRFAILMQAVPSSCCRWCSANATLAYCTLQLSKKHVDVLLCLLQIQHASSAVRNAVGLLCLVKVTSRVPLIHTSSFIQSGFS